MAGSIAIHVLLLLPVVLLARSALVEAASPQRATMVFFAPTSPIPEARPLVVHRVSSMASAAPAPPIVPIREDREIAGETPVLPRSEPPVDPRSVSEEVATSDSPPDSPAVEQRVVRLAAFGDSVPSVEDDRRTAPGARTGVFEAGDPPAASHGAGSTPLSTRTGGFDLTRTADTASARSSGSPSRLSRAAFDDDPGARASSVAMPERSRKVTNGGFDALPPPAAPRGSRTEPATIPEAPAEILTKPRPVYTAEARSLRIEGAVVLEILFRASGKVSVLRVLQGLGHGLDEAAIRAAEELVFRPALRDGRPVDSKSTVHVLFQLVY